MTKTCNVKNLSQILITLLFCSTLIAQEKPNASVAYIEQYKDIAISEMDRTGIPASIKLAQGLVESGAGQSTLSREANNHFGIKCNGGWTGPTHYRKDDDYKNGKLIKSCFRKFGSPHESYIAHSDFLTTQRRYSSLFELAHIDYYSWAHGLKKAGYATDPKYAHKLIDVIEKYQLFRYDDKEAVIIADEGSTRKSQSTHHNKGTQTDPTPPATVLASAEKKSRSNRSSKRKNSVRHFSKARLASAKTHRVAEGESLASIAKAYELEETSLRLRNRIPRDAQPLPGEKINLRKKISILKRPKFTRVPEEGVLASADDYLF